MFYWTRVQQCTFGQKSTNVLDSDVIHNGFTSDLPMLERLGWFSKIQHIFIFLRSHGQKRQLFNYYKIMIKPVCAIGSENRILLEIIVLFNCKWNRLNSTHIHLLNIWAMVIKFSLISIFSDLHWFLQITNRSSTSHAFFH